MRWRFTFLMIFGKLVHQLRLFAPGDQQNQVGVGGALLFPFVCSAERLCPISGSAGKGKKGM